VKNRNSADFPAAGLRWNVIFNNGENLVRAIGKKGKETVSDETSFVYQTEEWTAPTQLKVTTRSAGDDELWIEAELHDSKGVPCLDSRNYIQFQLAGDGKLIDNQGTSSGSRLVQAYNGRAQIKVKLNGSKNNVVAVKSEGIETKIVGVVNNNVKSSTI